jgi:DNA polymerase-3 subunit alpha
MAAAYVDVKHGRKRIEHYHPIVDQYASWTYGQIVYQEQVLRIIRDLGGFPMTKIHAIRQIISQKLGEAQFDEMYKEFEENACGQHGCTPAQARRIWRFMATSATYSFNIAHCISYSLLAFWQMWLKVHHPAAFYAAQLRKTPDDVRRNRLLKDAGRHGIEVVSPDIIESDITWTKSDDRTVCAGFLQIPGIGPKTAKAIVDYLDKTVWETSPDWDDLINVPRIGEATLNKIKSFALDPDPFNLNYIRSVMTDLRKELSPGNKHYLPTPTHTSDTLPRDGQHEVVWCGIPMVREYKDLIEDERARSGREVAEILESTRDPHLLKSCVLKCIDDGDDEVYVRFNRWCFPDFADRIESLRLGGADAIIIKGIKREGFGVSIQVRDLWAVEL